MNIIKIDKDISYLCCKNIYSNNFTSLIYLSMNTRENPEYLNQIKYILDNYPEELNKRNACGWNAITVASVNSNYTSNLQTVKLLLEYKPALEDALFYSIFYMKETSSFDAVKLLVNHDTGYVTSIYTTGKFVLYDFMNEHIDIDALEYILQRTDIDYTEKDKYNKSIYDYALEKNNPKIIELIKKYKDTSLDVKYALD